MNPETGSEPKSNKLNLLIPALVILLLAAIGFGAYSWWQLRTTLAELTDQKASSQQKIDDLQGQLKSMSMPAAAQAQAYYEMPELGIKIKLDGNLKDIVYAFDQKFKAAAVYTRNTSYLAAVDNKSDTYSLGTSPIGIVEVVNTIPSCQASCPSDIAKLSNGKHVLYSHPQSLSSDNPATQKLFEAAINSLMSALKTAQPI